MSDYAFVVSCNVGYAFGLLATMNAQNFFKTNADWEIAYEDFDQAYMDKVSWMFPKNVNWTHVSNLMQSVVDRRSDQSSPLNRFWLAYWLLAERLLTQGKYKAVCVIQADQFLFTNLDAYFKIAEAGVMVSSEYPFSFYRAENMPFGNDRAIWDRGQCALFDAVNFVSQEHLPVIQDAINLQCEDAFKGEANHSVISLNRSACRHLKRGQLLGLEGKLWVCDSIWPFTRLYPSPDLDAVYNDRQIPLRGWHCRWWQPGRAEFELSNPELSELEAENLVHNYNVTKNVMERYFSMIPEIEAGEHVEGPIWRRS